MDLKEDLECLVRKRLEVTTPEPVDAEVMAQLQQHPQLREPFRVFTPAQIKHLMDPNSVPRMKSKPLTRDQKLRILVTREYFPDLTYMQIAQKTGYTCRQVQYALHSPLTPIKRRGYKICSLKAQPNSFYYP
ncbi:hypothetical protein F4677DRAFT_407459 [Hypoxylon crocopeplum]|nr:hypothetical protein F4677DRAFT_407459 [Hypoxylon crocopeplum]